MKLDFGGTAVRAFVLLSLIVWLGGEIFFGAVLAPVAFRTLPSAHLAGGVVRSALAVLHRIGLGCGAVLLLLQGFQLAVRSGRERRLVAARWGLVLGMMVLTAVSDIGVIGPMERDRLLAGGDITSLPRDSVVRTDFDGRHAWSTRIEGLVVVLGLGVVGLLAVEGSRERAAVQG